VVERAKQDANRDWIRLLLLDGEHEGQLVDVRCWRDNERYPAWISSLRSACGELASFTVNVENMRQRRLVVDVMSDDELTVDAFISPSCEMPMPAASQESISPATGTEK